MKHGCQTGCVCQTDVSESGVEQHNKENLICSHFYSESYQTETSREVSSEIR